MLYAALRQEIVLAIHLPNYMDTADAEYRRMFLTNLLKDSALAAFALYIASNARHQRILEETEVSEEDGGVGCFPWFSEWVHGD